MLVGDTTALYRGFQWAKATGGSGQLLVCSIKGEVKKKHSRAGWDFSCFPAHLIEQDLF